MRTWRGPLCSEVAPVEVPMIPVEGSAYACPKAAITKDGPTDWQMTAAETPRTLTTGRTAAARKSSPSSSSSWSSGPASPVLEIG